MNAQKAPEVTRETVDEYIARVVAEAPPLSEEKKARLRVLLRPVRGGASA